MFRPFDYTQIQVQLILTFYVTVHLKEAMIVIEATSLVVTNRTLFCNFLNFNIFYSWGGGGGVGDIFNLKRGDV